MRSFRITAKSLGKREPENSFPELDSNGLNSGSYRTSEAARFSMPKLFSRDCKVKRLRTLQQFRECICGDEGYRFLIHDRDHIYSRELDASLKSLGVSVLKTPYKCPQANAFCERLIGSARRECLDFMIPFNEAHIRQILNSWTSHYNRGRPHSSLGPGIPDRSFPKAEVQTGHSIPKNRRIVVTSILGGLHHEYGLEEIAA